MCKKLWKGQVKCRLRVVPGFDSLYAKRVVLMRGIMLSVYADGNTPVQGKGR